MMILRQKSRYAGFLVALGRGEVEGYGVGEQGVLLAARDEGLARGASVVAVEGRQVEAGGG
jgi:hypothetical protein